MTAEDFPKPSAFIILYPPVHSTAHAMHQNAPRSTHHAASSARSFSRLLTVGHPGYSEAFDNPPASTNNPAMHQL